MCQSLFLPIIWLLGLIHDPSERGKEHLIKFYPKSGTIIHFISLKIGVELLKLYSQHIKI